MKDDVFRRPKFPLIFSVTVGTGIYIFTMIVLVLLFAMISDQSPKYRGSLYSFVYLFLIIISNFGGYWAARFYKLLQGANWILCAITASLAYPAFVGTTLFIIYITNWA